MNEYDRSTVMRCRFSCRSLPWALVLMWFVVIGGTSASAQTTDDRDDIEITVFTGISIDSFAAQELRKYINKEESGDVREQLVAGFDFSYRINKPRSRNAPVLWLYGETVHGV